MTDLVIKDHIALIDEIYSILLKDNDLIKRGMALDLSQGAQDKKISLMERLSDSVKALQQINEKGENTQGFQLQELIKEAKNKTMKMLMLDRENEQLMHQNNFEQNEKLKDFAPSRNQALKAYVNSNSSQK